jgi:hypothetical protein
MIWRSRRLSGGSEEGGMIEVGVHKNMQQRGASGKGRTTGLIIPR